MKIKTCFVSTNKGLTTHGTAIEFPIKPQVVIGASLKVGEIIYGETRGAEPVIQEPEPRGRAEAAAL